MSFIVELSITEKCNLGCPYCYVANKNKFMNLETFKKSLDKIHYFMKQAKENEYFLSFFGGEPLLNFELIKEAVPILKNDKFCHGFNIISNLTLLDKEKHKFIKDNKIGVSWSFDGIDANVSRPLLKTLENKNSNGEYYKNILDMYNDRKDLILDLVQGCKVMVWPGNCSNMTENFKFLLNYNLKFPDFSLVRDNVWTNDDVKIFENELHKLALYYIEQVKKGTICSIGFFRLAFLDSILGLTKGKRSFGCFASCSGCAVTSDGDFYPCQRFASKEVLKYDANHNFDYYKELFNPKNFKKCHDCDLKLVCNAGCTFSQILNDNQPLDAICELYHIIYSETFKIVDELKTNKTFKEIVRIWLKSIG